MFAFWFVVVLTQSALIYLWYTAIFNKYDDEKVSVHSDNAVFPWVNYKQTNKHVLNTAKYVFINGVT